MRVFFYTSHTLYLKVLIPLVIELLKREGVSVFFYKNYPHFYSYSPARFSKNPEKNKCINLSALDYVAHLIDYKKEWNLVKHLIRFTFLKRIAKYDVIVGTIKDLDALIQFKKRGAKKVYVVGYQHMPVLLSLGTQLKLKNKFHDAENIFIKDNEFSKTHDFRRYIRHQEVADFKFVNFSYLDTVSKKRLAMSKDCQSLFTNPYVLIFHPGGYRRIITMPGEDKKSCYRKQEEFIKRVCQPILEAGFIPVIKTHPLYARYHSKEDLHIILKGLVEVSPLLRQVIVTDESYWHYAFQSRLMLSFGSSGVYELYAAGLKNVLICAFLGESRAVKFQMFKNVYIDTYEEYLSLFKDKSNFSKKFDNMTSLVQDIYRAYSSLNNGFSTQFIAQEILQA